MQLWALGSNGHAQLSLGTAEDMHEPVRCVFPSGSDMNNSWSIHCGGNHTLLLTSDGSLFGCGSNEFHQLGLSDPMDQPTFICLHPSKSWKRVACGFNLSILVTRENGVFSTGTCSKGSLGLGPGVHSTKTLTRIALPNDEHSIVDLQIGLAHVLILLSDGSVFGWGASRKGQLGVNVPTPSVTSPILMAREGHGIAVGKDWSAIIHHNRVEIIGLEKFPLSVTLEAPVQSLTANWSTVHYIQENGKIKSAGRGDRGQLASPDLPCMTRIASGSEHSVAIDLHGDIYVWGWNEHGNCGPGKEDVRGVRRLVIPDISRAVGVAAGYGTTFIWGYSEQDHQNETLS